MSTGNTQTKYYGLALWAMVIILAVSNGFLLRQNLQLRNLLKKFEPDRLKAGDKLESFSALGLQGENIAIRQAMLESGFQLKCICRTRLGIILKATTLACCVKAKAIVRYPVEPLSY
jgi:hypothetical protein